jgi:hypothetical protein
MKGPTNSEKFMSFFAFAIVPPVVIGILGLQLYFTWFAPCATVKEYWYLTQTPARCINL